MQEEQTTEINSTSCKVENDSVKDLNTYDGVDRDIESASLQSVKSVDTDSIENSIRRQSDATCSTALENDDVTVTNLAEVIETFKESKTQGNVGTEKSEPVGEEERHESYFVNEEEKKEQSVDDSVYDWEKDDFIDKTKDIKIFKYPKAPLKTVKKPEETDNWAWIQYFYNSKLKPKVILVDEYLVSELESSRRIDIMCFVLTFCFSAIFIGLLVSYSQISYQYQQPVVRLPKIASQQDRFCTFIFSIFLATYF